MYENKDLFLNSRVLCFVYLLKNIFHLMQFTIFTYSRCKYSLSVFSRVTSLFWFISIYFVQFKSDICSIKHKLQDSVNNLPHSASKDLLADLTCHLPSNHPVNIM